MISASRIALAALAACAVLPWISSADENVPGPARPAELNLNGPDARCLSETARR
jgi:hypothetical protein